MAAPDFVTTNFYSETIAPVRVEQLAASRTLFSGTLAFAEAALDFLTCSAGLFATYLVLGSLGLDVAARHSARQAVSFSVAFGFVVLFLLAKADAYRSGGSLLQIRETERALRIPAQALVLLFVISSLLGTGLSWPEFIVGLLVIPALLIAQKHIFLSIATKLRRGLRNIERVVVYGGGDAGRSVLSSLLNSPRLSLEPVAVIDHGTEQEAGWVLEMGPRGRRSIPVRRGPVTPELLKSIHCDMLLLAGNLSPEELAAASNAALEIGVDVALFHGPGANEQDGADSIDVDGMRLTTSRERSTYWLYAAAKRAVDIVASSLLLVLLAPYLAIIAILVRLDSAGPAFFVQERVGRNGELFKIFKFRSMYAGAPKYALSPTSSNDPRITRIGRLLRRTSMDELPQLLNVFLGTMSLVGPRPEMPFIVERYNAQQRQRLQVVPGITGVWQLSADRSFPIHQNIQYDLYYIRNRTFSMDAAILIHTAIVALHGGI